MFWHGNLTGGSSTREFTDYGNPAVVFHSLKMREANMDNQMRDLHDQVCEAMGDAAKFVRPRIEIKAEYTHAGGYESRWSAWFLNRKDLPTCEMCGKPDSVSKYPVLATGATPEKLVADVRRQFTPKETAVTA